MICLYMYLIDICRLLVGGWLPSYNVNEVNIVDRPDYIKASLNLHVDFVLYQTNGREKACDVLTRDCSVNTDFF